MSLGNVECAILAEELERWQHDSQNSRKVIHNQIQPTIIVWTGRDVQYCKSLPSRQQHSHLFLLIAGSNFHGRHRHRHRIDRLFRPIDLLAAARGRMR